jgi:deazaflavin-dependent oxidoreductase (nitroreductase family)
VILWILSRIHRAIYRVSGGKVGGRFGKAPVLLLTTTGRKSGRRRTQPLLYVRDGDRYVVIASKGGSPTHPLWYLNLQANPAAAVTIGRASQPVQARDAEGEERERLWRAVTDLYSGYDKYAERTSRRIPVVVLSPPDPPDR